MVGSAVATIVLSRHVTNAHKERALRTKKTFRPGRRLVWSVREISARSLRLLARPSPYPGLSARTLERQYRGERDSSCRSVFQSLSPAKLVLHAVLRKREGRQRENFISSTVVDNQPMVTAIVCPARGRWLIQHDSALAWTSSISRQLYVSVCKTCSHSSDVNAADRAEADKQSEDSKSAFQ